MSALENKDMYKNFAITRRRKVQELPCDLVEVTHIPTGAKIIHLPADDEENFFCLSFKTIPSSSNGVAHILEHLALCGSKNFPVKDPFFSMTRRSMNTFMNAFTGADFTSYPAASQIEKDFYNLLDVYIDAVFHPNLSFLSFLQEGHRFEFSDEKDPSSLSITGVVYNEMKGALSNPMRRLIQEVNSHLFPQSTYGYNSGGDPQEILSLSLDELISFHKTYYHPSRCLFFFYGNIPLTTHLDFLEEKILSQSKPLPPIAEQPSQPRFLHPVREKIEYPSSQKEPNSSFLAFGWLTTKMEDQLECLALSLLDSMLLATDASPLKYALLQTGKCRQVASSCDTENPDVPFLIILTGCNEEDSLLLKDTLFNTLESIAEKGLSQEAIDIALLELEFAKSEITGDGSPFGLSLFFRSGLLQQHGIDPLRGMEIHSLFDELSSRLKEEPLFFPSLIRKYFTKNPHLVELVMTPSETKEEEELAEEKNFIKKTLRELAPKDFEEIVKNTTLLKQQQEEDQDISCLPTLHLQDVPKECKKLTLHHESLSSLDFYSHPCFTNGISYTSLVLPLAHVAEEDLWILRLFTKLLTQLGCGQRTYAEALSDIQAYTGGLYAKISLFEQASDPSILCPSFILKGKCLDRKLEKLFSLLFDYLTSPRFDEKDRIREVIEKHGIDLRNALQSNALDYALNKSGSLITPSRMISEHMYGISYYQKIQALLASYEEKEDWLLEKFKKLSNTILHCSHMHALFCGNDTSTLKVCDNNLWGIAEISGKPYQPFVPPQTTQEQQNLLFLIPSKISSMALVLNTVPYMHKDAPLLCLLSALMNNTFLHKKVREQGGAYGGGSSAQTTSGTFSFYSYKDPGLFSTYQAFSQAGAWIQKGEFDAEDLEEAKLSILQDLDSPIAPGYRTETAYAWWRQGRDDECRQHFRDILRNATKKDLQNLIGTYLSSPPSSFVAFTNKEAVEKNQPLFERAGTVTKTIRV